MRLVAPEWPFGGSKKTFRSGCHSGLAAAKKK